MCGKLSILARKCEAERIYLHTIALIASVQKKIIEITVEHFVTMTSGLLNNNTAVHNLSARRERINGQEN